MATIFKTLEQKALSLDEKERIELTLKLLYSLEGEANQNKTMDQWIEEAETRYQAWKRGEVKTISEEEATTHVQQHFEE